MKAEESSNTAVGDAFAGPRHARILAVSSSLRERSASRSMLEIACESVRATGGEVDWLDLRECPLPWFDNRDDDSTYPPIVHELRARFAAADGYLLATPQYHTGPSGVLKNLIDFVSYPNCETTGKVFGLIAAGGGPHGAWPTLGTLRLIGRALSGWVLPQQVTATPRQFDAARNLVDDDTIYRLRHLGHSLAFHAWLLARARTIMPCEAMVGHHNQREPLER
jgi:NAD(P)H-dependent FMN reductase